MKILVTGAAGQLGKEVLEQGRASVFEVIAADRRKLDITDMDQVAAGITEIHPELVVNTAAYTDVDKAETETELAYRVNTEGPANLAGSCAAAGIPLIHISTDYVFDGHSHTPYVESDPVAPAGVYARSKAQGEDRVRSLLPEHIILRTSWLYGVSGRNFVKTMLRLGRAGNLIRVVNDQFGSPTSAGDLAGAILKIAADIHNTSAAPWGTYHYCGKGITSRHRFAETIFSLADPYGLFKRPVVEAVSSDRYPLPAKRPRFSALDCTRIRQNFGITTEPWPQSLAAVIQRIMPAGEG